MADTLDPMALELAELYIETKKSEEKRQAEAMVYRDPYDMFWIDESPEEVRSPTPISTMHHGYHDRHCIGSIFQIEIQDLPFRHGAEFSLTLKGVFYHCQMFMF